MAVRKSLYDILKEMRACSLKDLSEFNEKARASNKGLDALLVEAGKVKPDVMCEAYSRQSGIPIRKLNDLDVDAELVMKVGMGTIKRYGFMPIKRLDDKVMLVAIYNPNDAQLDEYLSSNFGGYRLKYVLVLRSEIDDWVDRKAGSLSVEDELFDSIGGTVVESAAYDITDENESAAVVKIVNDVFYTAISKKASDIHIAPQEDSIEVRFRLDGMLKRVANWPLRIHSAILTRIKMMADMDIAETRRPQGGRIQLKLDEKEVDIRVSTLPTIYGEKVTMRILDKSNSNFDIKLLGMLPDIEEKFRDVISHTSGIVLVTGPTGSGKSTSLYAAMSELNKEETCIITLEDPVEYKVKGLVQVQMNPGAGLDFAAGLREVLRQDPDIVLIGEIRDGETAGIATQASNTGHLVFATLHTNDAPGSVIRLIEMGVEPFMVSSTLLAAMNQRLIRRVCPKCKYEYMLGTEGDDARVRQYMQVGNEDKIKLYKGKGCDFCNGTGYKGRIPIQEMLVVDESIKEALSNNATPVMLRELAIKNGMVTLKQDGIRKALLGYTSIDEVRRVIS